MASRSISLHRWRGCILNYEAVRFWQDMGATRAILARELPIKDVAEIKNKVPDMELECFIHGAQCVSFSGRCLLSDYMTNGDKIRSMTDEELASLIHRIDHYYNKDERLIVAIEGEEIYDNQMDILNWLKS